jgi:hypothetical protein
MDSDQIPQKINKIKEIYNRAVANVKNLELQQKRIIGDFIDKLEQRKIEEIRKKLSQK